MRLNAFCSVSPTATDADGELIGYQCTCVGEWSGTNCDVSACGDKCAEGLACVEDATITDESLDKYGRCTLRWHLKVVGRRVWVEGPFSV